MNPVLIRRLGISLGSACSLVTLYCGFCSMTGSAQPPAAGGGSEQKTTTGKPPSPTAPATQTPPKLGTDSPAPPAGKVWMDCEDFESDDHTGISTFRNWVYTRGDTVISGTTARYNRKTDTLDTDDPVVMNDSKHHLTADKAHVEHAQHDPDLRFVVLTGHAVMVLKPETSPAPGEVPPAPVQAPGSPAAGKLKVVSLSSQPQPTPPPGQGSGPPADARNKGDKPPAEDKDREDAKAQQRHGGTVTCDRIEYRTSKKFAKLTGHVVFKQNFLDKDGKPIERTMTCEHAENDGIANKLHLFKPVHFEDNDGESGDSKEDVIVGTKEGEENLTMKGHTRITLIAPDEDEDTTDSKSTNAKDAKHGVDKRSGKNSP